MKKPKLTFFTITGIIVFLLTLYSLTMNIKTLPLTKKSSVLSKQISILEEENQRLLFQISSQTTLTAIHNRAKTYQLVRLSPQQVHHINLP